MKKNIIISIPLVWSYRNFILSGIGVELNKEFTVYYAIPEIAVSSFKELNITEPHLLILKQPKNKSLQIFLFRVLKRAFSKRFEVNTFTIFEKINPNTKSTLKSKILYDLPALFFTSYLLFSILEKVENWLYVEKSKKIKTVLKKLNPEFVLSTTCVVDLEWPLFRVAQNLKIETFTHILSFDNLTSRGYLPIKKFNKYFVWNMNMANELIKYYKINPSKIQITGTPQFDYHTDMKYQLTKLETFKRLGLNDSDKYILYCANHFAISPNEQVLVETLLSTFKKNNTLASYKIVLRLHPMDDYKRWDALISRYPQITLSIPWEHKDSKSTYWGNPTIDDLILFSNVLKYGSIMLNIASTVSIDAAITNTPIVCIGFHPTINKEGEFYNEVHYSEHYAVIMKSGATPLANSMNELEQLMIEQLLLPEKLKIERLDLKNRFLPSSIESSASLLIDVLNG